MSVYYNEIDPFAAEWLRALMAKGLIPGGEVDERSICNIKADDLRGFTQCHFFAGIGGWPYALRLAGWGDDRFAWTGSCPCQPLSVAGKQKGADDERHLWPAFQRLIAERRPPIVFGEQVASSLGREWFAGVRADLEALGYAGGAADLCAAGVGAPHIRQRLYWCAVANSARVSKREQDYEMRAVAWENARPCARRSSSRYTPGDELGLFWSDAEWRTGADGKARRVKPGLLLLVDGLPGRVGRLRGYGNAIVPQVAQAFVESVMAVVGNDWGQGNG